MSKLQQLREQWDRLGRSDPFWAVLTDPDKRDGRWTADEFFETGTTEIAAVLEHARTLGLRIRFRRALDFGCGVGRVTQALANHFERCDGVDISPSMLEKAAVYNRHAGRCHYHLNETTDLGLFGDSTFDFVYSVLVLQHMAPEFAKAYLRELVRILVPGGLLVFQMLSHRSTLEPPRDAPRTMSTGPLPESAFKAKLSVAGAPANAQAGTKLELTVTVRNASEHAWPCLAGPDLTYQVNLGGRWLRKDATTHLSDNDGRCPLPFDLGPSDEVELLLSLPVPRKAGKYIVEFDMVQEKVAWFGVRGSAVLRAPFTVSGGRPGAARRVLSRAFRTLMHAAGSERRSSPSDPAMEMHFILRAEILEFLDQAGARILDVQHALLPGGLQSYHYWVTR